jgi:adenine deaminase
MSASSFNIKGNIVDIFQKKIFYGSIHVSHSVIQSIENISAERSGEKFILPGFIDSHVHVESSMLIPSAFARMAVVHGTVGTISDPHEIANVCGMEGVRFMMENGKKVPFKFHFGAPSCVPATIFETAGATLSIEDVDTLLADPHIHYLSEMMNFPGVLHNDPEVMAKIASAKKRGKPVDGHAPGLMGDIARQYIDAGITTDHECFTAAEASDKLKYGMKILIREGSAAKNFEALIPLLMDHPNEMMFCSDDKHPDSLELGHINQLCARAVAFGIPLFNVLQAACINPVMHYKMNIGLLRENDPADFVVIENLENFEVLKTFIDGKLVAENGKSLIEPITEKAINQFDCKKITSAELALPATSNENIDVIEALDGQLITNRLRMKPNVENGLLVSSPGDDILKIVVINRYKPSKPAIAFIRNFGIKSGAIASSVAHDSHNIVAVGAEDDSLVRAINLVIDAQGGICAVKGEHEKRIALPVAGLMSLEDGYEVSKAYTEIDQFVKKQMGSTLQSPFMTLSFMALLVIPHLKLSDKGLFDGDGFRFLYEVN